ncbi:Transcriptional activator of proteases prtT [Ceratocystis fimbriata CBS 114723]|uniref:Transcriptional activator of proteases prtT n=1 Tax=Ceratocystis fimbriata CBS 114723 TaxID=1035309 RepID=A0A2C5XDH5_9PEZI|nr:Transcriptional activator of proteases prtT [Ceratocystis fimbriata CBS 114723]
MEHSATTSTASVASGSSPTSDQGDVDIKYVAHTADSAAVVSTAVPGSSDVSGPSPAPGPASAPKTSTAGDKSSAPPASGSVAAEVAAVTAAGASGDQPKQRRRRRIFSCESCQRLKCRCDYDPNLQSCRRCQLLRIRCSRQDQDRLEPLPRPLAIGQASEDRIRALEEALAETQAMVKKLSSCVLNIPLDTHENDEESPPTNTIDAGPERISDPADHAISSAPVVVIRELGSRWAMANRKRKEYAMFDLVGAQLLDAKTADELIKTFFEFRGQTYHLDIPHGLSSETMRAQSPFLHSVCCLYAMTYVPEVYATSLHQRVYEKVRLSLGQILLTSPLHLEEIQGIFLMSNNATAPSENGPEYIDSWMLTGYCAEQAMLCISFSTIVNNIKAGQTTADDRAAIRLWATICVHHLRWAATTGRPSVIPERYIEQCNTLLSFYEATMQDGMLLAEIMLYSVLFQKLGHRPQLDTSGVCLTFDPWKRKWAHLLSLQTASMLQIGYNLACLTLCVRSLEDLGERISSSTILSSPGNMQESTPSSSGPTSNSTIPTSDPNDTRALLRLSVARSVQGVLETFLSMPHAQKISSTTNTLLAVGYCSLILAHYDAAHSHVSNEKCQELVFKYEEWCAATRGKEWALSTARLARDLLIARLQPSSAVSERGGTNGSTNSTSRRRAEYHGNFSAAHHRAMGMPPTAHGAAHPAVSADPMAIDSAAAGSGVPVGWDPDASHTAYNFTQSDFPNIEDFFSGGFLDFPRH